MHLTDVALCIFFKLMQKNAWKRLFRVSFMHACVHRKFVRYELFCPLNEFRSPLSFIIVVLCRLFAFAYYVCVKRTCT